MVTGLEWQWLTPVIVLLQTHLVKPCRPRGAAPIRGFARSSVPILQDGGWGAMVKESGVCSRLASDQGSGRQLLSGRVC